MIYFGHRRNVAQFVNDLLIISEIDCRSITITKLPRSEAYCVFTVIAGSSGDIVKAAAKTYCLTPFST